MLCSGDAHKDPKFIQLTKEAQAFGSKKKTNKKVPSPVKPANPLNITNTKQGGGNKTLTQPESFLDRFILCDEKLIREGISQCNHAAQGAGVEDDTYCDL